MNGFFAAVKGQKRVGNFPVSFFSVVMGLAGFVIALQKAADIFHLAENIGLSVLFLSIGVFIMILTIYLFKVLFYFDEVREEFDHPTKINFFPTISISLLLLSVALLPVNSEISKYLWGCGAVLHLFFTIFIVSIWMHHDKFKITHLNPSWFIPAVGNILVPVAGTAHFTPELSWFFFSFGLFFWMILLVVFFYRIFFHESLTAKLLPTLFILIAPPAVGFISYFKLTGEINDFSRILYYFSVFLTILLFSQVKVFSKIKYYLSWWAYSFPLASVSIASALMYHETRAVFFMYLFLVLLVLLTLLIVLLMLRTVTAIARKEICLED